MSIDIRGLHKVYRGGRVALDRLDLSVEAGVTGLLGTNGAGKTTLLRILTGTLRPTSGSVHVDGNDAATSAGRTAIKRTLGYLPQEFSPYPDLTGREFLDYLGLLKGLDDEPARRTQVEELLGLVGLEREGEVRIRRWSGGMRRRLGIAQVLLGDPRLIVVDEPTAGLDPEERMRFRSLIAGLGGSRTVLLSTHILDDVAQSCPRVAVLTDGTLAFHGPTGGLVAAADGQTHVVRADAPPVGDLTVVNAGGRSDAADGTSGTEYRVVGPDAPADAHPVSPTLDDGYVALLRAARRR